MFGSKRTVGRKARAGLLLLAMGFITAPMVSAHAAGWQMKPGRLMQISVGSKKNVWGVSSDQKIWRWTGSTWANVGGNLTNVAAAHDGAVWGVNKNGQVFQYGKKGWALKPGGLTQISVGSRKHVWGISPDQKIWRWTGSAWANVGGNLTNVSVGKDGTVWGVNKNGQVFEYGKSGWALKPGQLTQISVGSKKHVVGVSKDSKIWRWTGSGWANVPGGLKWVSVGPKGALWGVNTNDMIFQMGGGAPGGGAVASKPTSFGGKVKNFFKKGLNFVKKLKDKVLGKIKSFLPKALEYVKKLGATILRTVVEKVTTKIGFTLSDFFKIVDAKTGKINTQALAWFVVQRIGEFVKPIMEDKIQILVSKALRFIQKPLDAAVSAILGAVGSIPFAGSVLVTGIHAVYTVGMDYLRDSLAAKLSDLIYDRLVAPLFRKGLDKLFNLSPAIKAAVERVMARATKIFALLKPPAKKYVFSGGTGGFGALGARANARMKGKDALKAHDAKLKAAEDAARASKDAAHRRRGLLVERNVHGNTTSKKIYDAQRRAAARRAKREAKVKGK